MTPLLWIIISTFSVSLISLIGILVLFLKEKRLEKILLILVALSAGVLIGAAFLHLIPEAIESAGSQIFIYVLAGFTLFFFIEKILFWQHCHKMKCTVHTFTYLNLIGDGVHNFIDGLIIAVSFVSDIHLGFVTTLAVIFHEIPQEIGDFGVLIYGGIKKKKALLLNLISALAAMLGGIGGYFLSENLEKSMMFLLPFAAGGFIYIAASDLIPEIRKEEGLGKSLFTFGTFILGLAIMFVFKLVGYG